MGAAQGKRNQCLVEVTNKRARSETHHMKKSCYRAPISLWIVVEEGALNATSRAINSIST